LTDPSDLPIEEDFHPPTIFVFDLSVGSEGSSIASVFSADGHITFDVTVLEPVVRDISMSSIRNYADVMKILYDGSCVGSHNKMVVYLRERRSASTQCHA
jgi:hypothetical protein